ncbi:FAD-dependent oxidoreductase [Rhodanobacter sp. 7MK24]|uniref:GMC family oxidoreductase n=1 Tax=Rhodanobacter sp. 7MK24 TaxID=2775922 RepID=UPI00177EB616|nr:FAD-dependent oxidoreductase [Rhodanobacter sp. 7MK24]MBD8879214.1 FAD-dependent oxidoreductase [Rhodanobacter sp. 7MK24]
MREPRGAFDFIVVGAGPAGCATATRLATLKPDASVLLVETGPAKSGMRSDVPLGIATLVPFRNARNYSYRTVPQAGLGGRRGVQPRGRGLGGSSLINAMIYIRGQPEDYDDWARLGATGWAWRDVFPYFLRSEHNTRGADAWHATGGPLTVSDLASPSDCTRAFIEAAAQCGHSFNPDFNGASQEGVGAYQVFQQHGRRWNAARAYLTALAPKNLTVLAETPVARVAIEDGRATGIACANGGSYAARAEVVLAAGAFGTPQLLMLSGIGPAAHLRDLGIAVHRDARDVGANLQDHVDFVISRKVDDRGLFGTVPGILPQVLRAIGPFRRGTGLLTSNVAEAGGFLRTRAELARPDIQLHLCIGIVDEHSRRLHAARGLSLHTCVLRPHSHGSVRLASANVRAAPLIDPAFLSDPRDMETLLAGVGLARRILAAPAFARYAGPALYDAETDDEVRLREIIRRHADTIYHPVGTCRMGSDANAVVDPELRVRGVAGLRVADASIMPTLISGNTQAACAMIGERAAEFLAGG